MIGDPDLHRGDAALVVGADRREDDVAQVLFGRADAEHRLGGDHRRPDIEAGPLGLRNPVRLEFDQPLKGLEEEVFVDFRHAHALGAAIEAGDIVGWAEEGDRSVGAAKGLQPLEDFLGIVKDHGGRVERKGGVGLDSGIAPPLAALVFHHEHAVGELFAELQLTFIRDRLLFIRYWKEFDLHRPYASMFDVTKHELLAQTGGFRQGVFGWGLGRACFGGLVTCLSMVF